jgi:hypothetical protein
MDEMPQKDLQIDFSLRGTLGGVEITPATTDLTSLTSRLRRLSPGLRG